MLTFPDIDPVLLQIGPFAIRWYSLAYVGGIVLGCIYADWLNKKPPSQPNLKVFDDFLVWVVLGIILGGRIGYILFYNLGFYLENPSSIIEIWKGGMSFHGGFIGVVVAVLLFCRKYKVEVWALLDLAACVSPIGLCFGRLANFINGELFGRVTDSPWGMVFPDGGPEPRHPSQLYEATLEGLVLFLVIGYLACFTRAKSCPRLLSGVFLCGYALSRMVLEQFREPDSQLGFILGNLTMGQLLSAPMLFGGIYLILYGIKHKPSYVA